MSKLIKDMIRRLTFLARATDLEIAGAVVVNWVITMIIYLITISLIMKNHKKISIIMILKVVSDWNLKIKNKKTMNHQSLWKICWNYNKKLPKPCLNWNITGRNTRTSKKIDITLYRIWPSVKLSNILRGGKLSV